MEIGRIGAAAVVPTGSAAGMVAGHIVVGAVVDSIDFVVVPGRGMETLEIAGIQGTGALGQAGGERVCYTLAALEGMGMKAHHREPEVV